MDANRPATDLFKPTSALLALIGSGVTNLESGELDSTKELPIPKSPSSPAAPPPPPGRTPTSRPSLPLRPLP